MEGVVAAERGAEVNLHLVGREGEPAAPVIVEDNLALTEETLLQELLERHESQRAGRTERHQVVYVLMNNELDIGPGVILLRELTRPVGQAVEWFNWHCGYALLAARS